MASNTTFLYLSAISILLSLVISQAFGSSRSFAMKDLDPQPQAPIGLCNAAVMLRGYKCQEYQATTDDGYIIGVLRIPEGVAGGGAAANRTPVLLQHGLLVDGLTWVMLPTQLSLATILADNGFDVWISNHRGTQFSQRHVNMSITNPAYWNWSWDELAEHDLDGVLGLILNQTGQKAHYVGHSQGTLIALTALSEGKLVNMLKSAALLAPVAYLNNIMSPFRPRIVHGETGTKVSVPNVDSKDASGSDFLKGLCSNPAINCYDMPSFFMGAIEPQPTSNKNLEHFDQTRRDRILRKFDYGFANMQYYNQPTPTVYDLSKIPHDFPLYLSYGGQDQLADVADVQMLIDVLKGHDQDKLKVQFLENYTHGDFIMAANAKDVVYNNVADFFRQFS